MAGDEVSIWNEHIIEEVLQGSIDALRSTREQVFQIAESGRTELDRLRLLVEQVKEQARQCVANVDEIEERSRKARQRLTRINNDFGKFSDPEIREAYSDAERCLVQLGAAREREDALRRRRDDLTRQLKHLEQLLGKADHAVTHVGMALDFLTGNWDKMNESVDGMRDQADLARRVILAQENERRRVARDIHDGPAQLLANLAMRVELLGQSTGDKDVGLKQELSELQAVVRDSLHDLRRVIFNLRPMALDDLGLAPAIRGYIEMLREQVDFDVELQVHGRERRLAPATETALFRVLQEALNNAHHHSASRRAHVVLEFAAEGVRLSVRDSGQGFDPKSVSRDKIGARFGLMNMRERVRLLGGAFRIVSAPGQGTQVTVSVPWAQAAAPADAEKGGSIDDGYQSPYRG